jgi:hypothetical protein
MADRQIVYAGAIPQEVDILATNKFAMVGLGYLALDLLGSGTAVSGLACTATAPASLNVQIGPGRLYSLQNVDNTAYSSLPIDSAHQILKQGILADALALGCAAPGTFGFSINYLIQASYQDLDVNLVTLPYYNVNNPTQAFSGPGNNGTAQATTRSSTIVISAKPGTAATTGTQTTPAPDAGFVGLYVVTVANGQTTITSANISTVSTAPFINGSFPLTLSGPFATPVTVNVNWTRQGKTLNLFWPRVAGNASAVAASVMTAPPGSIPAPLVPILATSSFLDSTQALWAAAANVFTGTGSGGVNVYTEVAHVGIDNTGAVTIAKATNWNTTGINGISAFTMSYQTA